MRSKPRARQTRPKRRGSRRRIPARWPSLPFLPSRRGPAGGLSPRSGHLGTNATAPSGEDSEARPPRCPDGRRWSLGRPRSLKPKKDGLEHPARKTGQSSPIDGWTGLADDPAGGDGRSMSPPEMRSNYGCLLRSSTCPMCISEVIVSAEVRQRPSDSLACRCGERVRAVLSWKAGKKCG
jgi:hypothetical protein